MRTMIQCDYGENFRNLSFPCTERELQIFCDSLSLPNEANAKIHVGRVHDNPQMDTLLAGKEVGLDELNYFMKRLDSFDEGEMNTFYALARGQKLTTLKDLINPTRSDGNNMLHLVNKYMDGYRADESNLVAKAKAEKYAKIIAKTIINAGDENFGQNQFFYDAAEGLLTAVILLIAEYLPPTKNEDGTTTDCRHIVPCSSWCRI